MSTPQDRFQQALDAYRDAWDNRKKDRADCQGDLVKLKAVNANIQGLNTQMLRGAKEWLEATGPDVEAAYADAIAAKKAVDDARSAAVGIVTRINAISSLLGAVKTLIDKASTNPNPEAGRTA